MSTFEVVAKKDWSVEVATAIPEATTLANEKGLNEALDLLLNYEKKCRNTGDTKSLEAVCLHMVKLCKEKQDWVRLNSILELVHKRNTQAKAVIQTVTAESMKYLDVTPSEDVKVGLIKTLKDICEGKIYVEAETALLHFTLSKIYEARGDIDNACNVVQDVHVETYGSLDKMQKATYILEQIRLNLLRRDFVRTLISSRKMNLKTLEEEDFIEVKIKYYTMMVEYYMDKREVWDICQSYYKIASAKLKLDDKEGCGQSLESSIIFLIMAKFNNEQSDMMHRLKKQLTVEFKTITLPPVYSDILRLFTTHEIIPTPFNSQSIIENHSSLAKYSSHKPDTKDVLVKMFHDRVVQHNLRVICRYYQRIRMSRLSELLALPVEVVEAHLAEVASGYDIFLKIDRPAGIVSFVERKKPEEVLSEWSSDIGKMMQLMESTCHLINREMMVHKQ